MKLFSGKLIKSKKGGMELSINAIVILILAITMLGLGLTFVRSMFGSAGSKLGKVVETTSLKEPASAEKPLTIDSTITVKQGKQFETEIGFYNKYPAQITKVQPKILQCFESGKDAATTKVPSLTTPSTPVVAPGKGAGFQSILDISGTALEAIFTVGKTFICSLAITGIPGDATNMPSGQCPNPDQATCLPFETTQFILKIAS